MVLGRAHRAHMSFPVHFTAPDHSRTYIGETIDISSTGFSVQVRSDEPLPAIILAGILPSRLAGDAILCKARIVWQGGVVNGLGRASYKIISIAQKSQERLDQLIQRSLHELLADLTGFPLFHGCEADDLELLLGIARTRDVPGGTLLYKAGRDQGLGIYIILEGEISVARHGPETGLHGPGSVVGCWTSLEPQTNAETARTIGRTRYLYVPLALLPEIQRRLSVIASVLYEALMHAPQARPVAAPDPTASTTRSSSPLLRLPLPHDLQEIPTLPAVFNAVMECIEGPGSTAQDLADILSRDPSLTAKVLQTANSTLSTLQQPVTTVHEAVALLGRQQIAHLAITSVLLNALADEQHRERGPEEFWEHALATAHFTEIIARRILKGRQEEAAEICLGRRSPAARADGSPRPAPAPLAAASEPAARSSRASVALPAGRRTGRMEKLDSLFSYALLHDLGLVVLFLKFPDQFSTIRESIARYGDLHSTEQELLEIDHCQLGYRVAKAWRLPEPIPTIIAEHHLPQEWAKRIEDRDEVLALLREEPVVTLISLADLMTRKLGIGVEMDAAPVEIPAVFLESLGLGADDMDACLREGPAIRERVEGFFRGLTR